MTKPTPKLSIGVPVYNGEHTLRAALGSLVRQTFSDIEIIISDNASTDGTEEICREFAKNDPRIRYIRQSTNLGATGNFKFVLDQASANYFMWAAADDVRSTDFVDINVSFLDGSPDYVASTSPNCFEGQNLDSSDLITFGLEGNKIERLNKFIENGWESHGIFYSVIRTGILKQCSELDKSYFGWDWSIDLFLASRGKIHRTEQGLLQLGAAGVSNSSSAWRAFRTNILHWPLPFLDVSRYVVTLTAEFSMPNKLSLYKRMLILNCFAARAQLLSEFYPFYKKNVRHWLRGKE